MDPAIDAPADRADVLAPVRPDERIAELDILRGFALLGIFIINMPGFNAPWGFEAAGDTLFPVWYDEAAEWLVNFVGSGKFNSMFSFLFGLGFAIQLERAAARGAPFVATYLRRLLALLAFGLIHLFLIWDGDVLHIYALIGLPLLLVRKVPDRWLLALAALLLLTPVAHGVARLVAQTPRTHDNAFWRALGEEQLRTFGHGTWAEADALRARHVRLDYIEGGGLWFWPILGTTMVLGFLVGRRRVFQDLTAHLPRIRRLVAWSGGVGLALAAAFATCSLLAPRGEETPTLLGGLGGLFYVLNRPVLCLFYMAGLVLIAQSPRGRAALAPLRAVGRMPLTNYLMQSVLASLIFYGYGLGFFGTVGPALGVLIALSIYAVQVVYSNLWMARFRFGPMEWLWRTLTYGRPPAVATVGVESAPARA